MKNNKFNSKRYIKAIDDLLDLIKNIVSRDAKNSLLALSKQIEQGADVKDLALSLMDILRNMVFIKNYLGEELVKPNWTEDKYEDLIKMAESFSNNDLTADLGVKTGGGGRPLLARLRFSRLDQRPI